MKTLMILGTASWIYMMVQIAKPMSELKSNIKIIVMKGQVK